MLLQVSQSYSCPHCPASFQGPGNLVTHVREVACRTKKEQGKTERSPADVECIDLLIDEEDDIKQGYFESLGKAGKTIVKGESATTAPPTVETFSKPRSQAQLTAEVLARRGLFVTVVSPEQEQLQEVVRSLGAVEKQLAVLLGKARQVQPGGAKSLRAVLGKELSSGLKEVQSGLSRI